MTDNKEAATGGILAFIYGVIVLLLAIWAAKAVWWFFVGAPEFPVPWRVFSF